LLDTRGFIVRIGIAGIRLREDIGLASLGFEFSFFRLFRTGAAAKRCGWGLSFSPRRRRRVYGVCGSFLKLYGERLAVETRSFPGFEPVFEALEGAGIPWGIVTNKPGF